MVRSHVSSRYGSLPVIVLVALVHKYTSCDIFVVMRRLIPCLTWVLAVFCFQRCYGPGPACLGRPVAWTKVLPSAAFGFAHRLRPHSLLQIRRRLLLQIRRFWFQRGLRQRMILLQIRTGFCRSSLGRRRPTSGPPFARFLGRRILDAADLEETQNSLTEICTQQTKPHRTASPLR